MTVIVTFISKIYIGKSWMICKICQTVRTVLYYVYMYLPLDIQMNTHCKRLVVHNPVWSLALKYPVQVFFD